MITWDPINQRYFHHGLDHGVVYIGADPGIAWNGLIAADEGGEGTTEMLYRDGVVYLADAEASDHIMSIRAIMYPDAFGACIGIPKVTDGLYIDNQKPQRFHMSYRTLVGNGSSDDQFGHQIHLIYNCMATVKQRQRNTIGRETAPTEFEFDVVCTPVRIAGYRPSAHLIIDTRNLSPSTLTEIEAILYEEARMPGPQELADLMNFGDALLVTDHGDGTYSITGSEANVINHGNGYYTINNLNATAPDVDGEFVISDGGDTTVVTA